ncbi:substrate-binding domain-containing protein [Deinococcus sp.]|uniref:substrate-binding domain-containing protein n=1 Tax=Deinococcus sp. TaxID=47478 RepID=UPI00286DC9DD|nr:substrate-binding domain-containing protein [Deinococcus sp.]
MQKIGRQLLALTALCSLVTASNSLAQAKKTYKVGAAVYGLKAEFMQIWVNALKQHPAIKDGTVQLTVFDGNYDALTQNNQFDTMITQKFDGIIFAPIDIQAGAEAVDKAFKAKIPVVGSNTQVNSKNLTAYIGSNDVLAGELVAQSVVTRMGGKGNVVILEGPIGQSAQIQRRQGIMKVLAKNKNIKVLEQKTANWSRAEALTLTENWLTAHPGQINGIIGQNDEMALGAIEALKSQNLDPKKIPVAGVDGVTDAILSVKKGDMASVLQDARAQAQGALDLVLRQAIGSSYQPKSDIWKQYATGMPWKAGTQKVYSVPWTPITIKNADQLLSQRK